MSVCPVNVITREVSGSGEHAPDDPTSSPVRRTAPTLDGRRGGGPTAAGGPTTTGTRSGPAEPGTSLSGHVPLEGELFSDLVTRAGVAAVPLEGLEPPTLSLGSLCLKRGCKARLPPEPGAYRTITASTVVPRTSRAFPVIPGVLDG